MRKFSPLIILPPLVFFGLAGLFLFSMNDGGQSENKSALIGKPAPQIKESTLEGYPAFTNDMIGQGEVILINFWASWCPPCRAEHPTLKELSDRGIPLYGVNFKDRPENALRFLEEDGNPFAGITADREGRTGIDWGVAGLPETFIIDGEGKILYRFAGPLIEGNYANVFLPELEAALAGN